MAGNNIKIIVDGKEVTSDVEPQIINGRVMIPARPLAEALGAKVEWNGGENTVEVTSNSYVHTEATLISDDKKESHQLSHSGEWIYSGDLLRYGLHMLWEPANARPVGDGVIQNIQIYIVKHDDPSVVLLTTDYFLHEQDATRTVNTNLGEIRIRPMNLVTYFNIEDLKRTGLIP